MFYLVGIGQKPEHLTPEAMAAVKKCKKVFFDSYTNFMEKRMLKEFEKKLRKKIIVLDRKKIEEEFKPVILQAKKQNICLLVPGNPLTATTHVQLLIEAKNLNSHFSFVPGISITDYLPSTGLDSYRFGRITTIVAPKKNFAPESFFDAIEKNLSLNLHTLCLLEIDAEKNYFMAIPEAINILEKIAEKKQSNAIQGALLVGLYGVGGKRQKTVAGKASGLKKNTLRIFPQSLVVCARLNEKEREALELLAVKA